MVVRTTQILKESFELAQNGKTFGTRLSRCDLAIEKVQEILPLEKRGIPTVDPSPSVLLPELKQMREAVIEEEVRSVVDKASKSQRLQRVNEQKKRRLYRP